MCGTFCHDSDCSTYGGLDNLCRHHQIPPHPGDAALEIKTRSVSPTNQHSDLHHHVDNARRSPPALAASPTSNIPVPSKDASNSSADSTSTSPNHLQPQPEHTRESSCSSQTFSDRCSSISSYCRTISPSAVRLLRRGWCMCDDADVGENDRVHRARAQLSLWRTHPGLAGGP